MGPQLRVFGFDSQYNLFLSELGRRRVAGRSRWVITTGPGCFSLLRRPSLLPVSPRPRLLHTRQEPPTTMLNREKQSGLRASCYEGAAANYKGIRDKCFCHFDLGWDADGLAP